MLYSNEDSMRPIVTCLLILLVVCPFAGCKRRAIKGAATAPRVPPPTAESLRSEEMAKIKATLDEVPFLAGGVNFIDPVTKELWERFPNGMMFQEITRTAEPLPQIGQMVSIAYTGTVYGGTKPFDSATVEKPFKFRFGSKTEVIKGMQMAVGSLHLHGKRRILIPPEFAYGPVGQPSAGIGPNAPLVFEIELLDIEGDPIKITPEFVMPQPMGPHLPETSTAPATAPAATETAPNP
jgi:hypothetical protein